MEASQPTTAPHADASVRRGIEIDFPGWGVWRSGTGRWWAFRTYVNPLSIEQLRSGRRLIVQADTVTELRTAIRAEIEPDGRTVAG